MKLAAALAQARNAPCLLCGRDPVAVGIWTTTAAISRKLGAPDGKHRCVSYALCRRHAKPRFSAEVEATLIRAVTDALSRPEAN